MVRRQIYPFDVASEVDISYFFGIMVKTSEGRQITELGLQHLGQEFQETRFLKA